MRAWFENASIRGRLTAGIMAASAGSVLLTVLVISAIGFYEIRRDMQEELSVSASLVGDRNAAALLFGDDRLAENNLRVLGARQAVESACLYDSAGHVFARYVRDANVSQECPADLTPRRVFSARALEVMKSRLARCISARIYARSASISAARHGSPRG